MAYHKYSCIGVKVFKRKTLLSKIIMLEKMLGMIMII